MPFELTRMDEWPRHQTGGTFDVVATASPHWSDGYYFTMGDDAGDVAFFQGFRLYPNTDVLDAFTCVSTDGRQHNMRWSRRLRPRIDDLVCGAQAVEIVEGLRTLRITAEPNAHGISYDLTFRGLTPPYNEAYLHDWSGGMLAVERSNFDQCCAVEGWLAVRGREWEVTPERWTGVRDHSWGMGRTGGPIAPGVAPARSTAQPFGIRQWVVARFPRRVVFWQFHHSAEGKYTKVETRVLYPYDDDRAPWSYTSIAHELSFVGTERRLASGRVSLRRPDGGEERFGIETISHPVYLQGGGYWAGWDDGLGRGVYRGEAIDEGETWDVSHPTTIGDPKGRVHPRPDAWAETWGRFTNLDDPEETGTGHLECVVSGPYPGFD
jgi:hypothetical protein